MATTLPQVTVATAPGGRGHVASCTCKWSIRRTLRIDADLEAVQHRASHATPLHEDDDDRPWRIDEVMTR